MSPLGVLHHPLANPVAMLYSYSCRQGHTLIGLLHDLAFDAVTYKRTLAIFMQPTFLELPLLAPPIPPKTASVPDDTFCHPERYMHTHKHRPNAHTHANVSARGGALALLSALL